MLVDVKPGCEDAGAGSEKRVGKESTLAAYEMGGKMWAESEVGKGSTYLFAFEASAPDRAGREF